VSASGAKSKLLDTGGYRAYARRPLAWNGPLVTLLTLVLAVSAGLSLIQLSPLEGAALVGLLAVVVGALIEPFVALGVALFLGPLKAYLSIEVPQIPAQIGHAFVALALASWLMRGLSERKILLGRQTPYLRSPVFLSLMAFLGTALLSLWDAVGLVTYGIPELIKWIEILLLFIFVREHLAAGAASTAIQHSLAVRRDGATRRLWWLMATLIGTGVFQALMGIWQFGLRGEGPEHFRILGGDFFRAYGTFEQPNPYAGYLALTAALTGGTVISLVWDRMTGGGAETGSWKASDRSSAQSAPLLLYLLGGSTVAMLVALVASWSRGAWMGFGAAALAIAAALPRKAIGSVLLVIVLLIGGAGLYASGQLPSSFVARLTTFVEDIRLEDVRGVPINDANYAVIERLAHWQAASSMFRHRLWTGVGFGCYEAAYPAFALINWPLALGHAHNIYLNLAAETGLIGLAAYLILWGVVLWQTWRATRRARGLMRGLAVGLWGAWAHISVHHLLDNLYVNNVHLHIGVLLGLAAFVIQQTNQTARSYDR
jgi:O-antigen ligase